jgi:hypothetical protein
MEAGWLAALTGMSGIAISLLGILLVNQRNNRLDIKEQVNTLKTEMQLSIEKICLINDREHEDMWLRVNHHKHNGNGNVVISE